MRHAAAILIGLVLLGAGLATAAEAQVVPGQTEMTGGHYRDDTEKAANHYARGLRAKRKAEGESDPAKQRKQLERAKEELSKAVGLIANFDHLLALGQVYLALGQKESALDACTRALGYKPANLTAQACQDAARVSEASGG